MFQMVPALIDLLSMPPRLAVCVSQVTKSYKDADGNIPHVGQTGSATTQFSKKPRTRDLQRRKMMKKYRHQIAENREHLAQELFKNRQRYILKDILPQDLATIEHEPPVLDQIISTYDKEEELLSIEDIAMVGSNFEPNYKLWTSLEAIEVDEDTDFIAEDRYFEVNMGSSIAAAVKLFFAAKLNQRSRVCKADPGWIIQPCLQIAVSTQSKFQLSFLAAMRRVPVVSRSCRPTHVQLGERPTHVQLGERPTHVQEGNYLENPSLKLPTVDDSRNPQL